MNKIRIATASAAIIVVFSATLLSRIYGDIMFPYFWPVVMILALALICRINSDFTFNKAFLWTYLTYIIGKALSLAIILFLLGGDENMENFSYSISSYSYGETGGIISEIINWFLNDPSSLKKYAVKIFITLYKGIFVAVAIGALFPTRKKK